MNRKALLFTLCLILCGCSSTGIVPTDKGFYMVSRRSPQFGFGPPVGVKADAYKEANDFCGNQSKQVETVVLETTDSGFFRPASVSLHFRCTD